MPSAKKKKSVKKAVHTKNASHIVSSHKVGHRHSSVFSDNVLMLLALFFALVGLLMVMVMKRQNDDFDAYVQKQQMAAEQQYLPVMKTTPTPMIKKGK